MKNFPRYLVENFSFFLHYTNTKFQLIQILIQLFVIFVMKFLIINMFINNLSKSQQFENLLLATRFLLPC